MLTRELTHSLADRGAFTTSIRRPLIAALDMMCTILKNDDFDVCERYRIENEWAALDRASRIRRQVRS